MASWDGRYHHYKIFKPGDDTAWLHAVETPPVSDQLQAMVSQVQQALPNILALTNKIAAVLDNAANATSNLNVDAGRGAADDHEFRRRQRATARAGRPDGLGAGHEWQSSSCRAL